MKKRYIQPRQRIVYLDTQNLIAASEKKVNEDEVDIDEDGNINSLSREDNLWDNEWWE